MEAHLTEVACKGSTDRTFELHHLTDTHIDDPDHAAEVLQARINHIRDTPGALWLGGGDYASLILPGDKRFGSGGHLKNDWLEHMSRLPDFYLDRCAEVFGPIADKCVGLGAGNHEATIGRNFHRGVAAELAARLGNPALYLGDRGWCLIRFRRPTGHGTQTLRVFQYHGWSAGRLKGRKLLQAERDLGAWAADVFTVGHDHQPMAHLWYTQHAQQTKRGVVLINRPRAVLNGGSWGHGQKPPSDDATKRGWAQAAKAPGQSWVEGRNYRPEAPDNPYLLIHLDWGGGSHTDRRPMGFDLEVRWRGNRHTLGEAA